MNKIDFIQQAFYSKIERIVPENIISDIMCAFNQTLSDVLQISEATTQNKEPIELFLKSKEIEEKSKGTLKTYRSYLGTFFKYVLKPTEKITTADIRDFLSFCKKEKRYADNSIETVRRVINGFFEFCVLEEILQKNPCKRIKPICCEKASKKAMKPVEIEYMREACKTLREKALVDFLYSTGCRVSETCNAKIDDIDWEKKTLFIRLGKGKKSRLTFLNPRAEVSLKAYLSVRDSESPYIFIKDHGKSLKPLVPATIQRSIKTIQSRAKQIKTHITPHVFRHTIATIALAKGMPVEHVQKFLGHANLNTTMIYADVDMEDVRMSHKKHAC